MKLRKILTEAIELNSVVTIAELISLFKQDTTLARVQAAIWTSAVIAYIN